MIREILNTEIKSIENDGIDVVYIEDYKVKNMVSIPFSISNFSVLLIKSGKMNIRFQDETNIVSRKDLLVIPFNSICTRLETTDNLQLYLVRTNFDFAFNNCYEKELLDAFSFLMLKADRKISLQEKDFKVLSLIYKLLYVLQNSNDKPEVIIKLRRICFNLFIYELKFIHSKYKPNLNLEFSRRESIVMQFLTILSIHLRKQHHVQFYAGALFITPGHLNKMVKECTGKTAKEFIIEALVNVAKNLLTDSSYSVANIANELEFSSAENFGVFFKRHTGMLPTEFRSNKK
ncbi:helix-turn-helix domain-containing protein [Flavobacterium quisquiliarum]|uniref:Helix-turn-helix domain-containing protein n=1 Tax=Flavobacterium quisquiliarum TaxID=1834436 RepID=A0ABV8WAG4_9FLAO|nr:helix-turn-helix domain-containing protein [Flavobacterium quisquiliarum]MBW1655984.1 helix-turn-helix domain-containing protein [Flavobacterium quisquiliarum]